MKNMLDELRKLDEQEEYEVPIEFREKVITRILKEKSSNKLKYIIPACSAAVVGFIVIFSVSLNKFDREINLESGIQNEYVSDETVELASEDSTYDDLAIVQKNIAMSEMRADTATKLNDEYFDEIIDMLKINKVEAHRINNEIKAKGKKEDIEVILFYFENHIELTQDGEYVLIKPKYD